MVRAEVQPTIEGLQLIECRYFHDSRGFFTESFREETFQKLGLTSKFIQDNHSRSLPRVLRGLHLQRSPDEQGKLVRVMRGKIWDVTVDLRKGSASFGKSFGCELSDANGLMLWVPKGFAHGFAVLGDEPADVFYKVDAYYNPKTDGGVRWNDPELGIEWPIREPIVSVKDAALPLLRDFAK